MKVKIEGKIQGVILADQIKSLGWIKREAAFIAKADKFITDRVIDKVSLLIIS